MIITEKYIRNASIRAAAQKLADAYPQFSDIAFTAHNLKFHGQDNAGKFQVWQRAEIPLYAFTSDISYWMSQDGYPVSLYQDWWSICDVLAGYLVLSAQSGKTFTQASDYPVSELAGCGIDATLSRAVLTSFSRHVSEIQYGSYLYNPSNVLKIAGATDGAAGSSGGKGLMIAAVGASLLGLAIMSKKR